MLLDIHSWYADIFLIQDEIIISSWPLRPAQKSIAGAGGWTGLVRTAKGAGAGGPHLPPFPPPPPRPGIASAISIREVQSHPLPRQTEKEMALSARGEAVAGRRRGPRAGRPREAPIARVFRPPFPRDPAPFRIPGTPFRIRLETGR